MIVAAKDGRYVTIRRRWMPWRLRKRRIDLDLDPVSFLHGADDLAGIAFGLVVGIVLFLFGGIIATLAIFASEGLLLLLLLVPAVAALRMFWVLPWVIEATHGDQTLGTQKVRGWQESEARILEIAASLREGRDPFAMPEPSAHHP